MFSPSLLNMAKSLIDQCRAKQFRLATAESCTGGLIGALLTEIPGASDVFDRGFITYANVAKTDMLEVPLTLIETQGAVSAEVAEAMAWGALDYAAADMAVAVTGVAGPGGGTPEKPVGLVYIAVAQKGGDVRHLRCQFSGSRSEIRFATLEAALQMMLERL